MAANKLFVDMFGNCTNKKKLVSVAIEKYVIPNLQAISQHLRDAYLNLISTGLSELDDWTDFTIDVLSEMYSEGLVLRLPDVEFLKAIAESPTLKEQIIEISKVTGKFALRYGLKLGLYFGATLLGLLVGKFL